MKNKSTPYLGSVRFFKHLILTCLALMIAVPTVFSIVLAVENQDLRAQTAAPPPSRLPLEAPTPSPIPAPAPVPVSASAVPETQPPLAAEVPAWQALYPEMYAPEAARSTIDMSKTVYLTFDDGPSANTPEILKLLDEYDVKATFFVVGIHDNEQTRQWMRDIVDAGHSLGIHSYYHEYKDIYASTDAFLADYNQMYQFIYDATGAYPTISRFPGGSINGYDGAIYTDLISELVRRGFVYFDWNVDSGDAAENGMVPAWKIARNALARVDTLRRAIVLMHDSAAKPTTVEALPAIIEGYRDAGFTFEVLTPEVVPVVYIYPE